MNTYSIEQLLKLLRAGELAQQTAKGTNPADTAKEYNLLNAQATYTLMANLLHKLAEEAQAEANRMEAAAMQAAAERKAVKKQEAKG